MSVSTLGAAERPLRVGLIGCGKMGMQHLKAIAAAPPATVVGIADPQADADVVRELAPSAQLVSDARELLETLRPDVVHIVTPPATHAALAQQAIEAGCHVYVEKPFTPTRAEAEAIFAAAAARGVQVCAGHQVLFEPPALLTRRLLEDIGRIVHVESFFSFRTARRTITPVDQAKDILPHAVYPLIDQLAGAAGHLGTDIELVGARVRADGDIHALVRVGDVTGVLIVTLNGRPVEQYQSIVGTNGSLRADYITGSVTRLFGPGAGLGVLFTPYRRALQTLTGATRGFAGLALGKHTSYPGLRVLVQAFYRSIREGTAPPLTPQSICETVGICERLGAALDEAERGAETVAQQALTLAAASLPATRPDAPLVVVTGATGQLGRRVVAELRHAGFPVRGVARRVPRYAARVAGVEYVVADLARSIDPGVLRGAGVVVHCAAETAGGRDEHRRNSVEATARVLEAAALAGVRRAIYISSLAVLKPGREVGGLLDEQSPLDAGHFRRGPYVWGKAEAEKVAASVAAEHGIELRIIRPGPLVDYDTFSPPGRLGRELGPIYVAIGGRRSRLAVCDVGTAARVIRSYVERFEEAPPLVNLVEAPPPTRRELVTRLRTGRPDLRVVWFPGLLLRALSGPLKLAQRLLPGHGEAIDLYAAFASERYRTDVAAAVIDRAGPSAASAATGSARRSA